MVSVQPASELSDRHVVPSTAGDCFHAGDVALLIVLARTPRDHGWTAARKIRFSLDVLCLVLFVPYMIYWNVIGLRF